jgi:hypothetical protein
MPRRRKDGRRRGEPAVAGRRRRDRLAAILWQKISEGHCVINIRHLTT